MTNNSTNKNKLLAEVIVTTLHCKFVIPQRRSILSLFSDDSFLYVQYP